MAVIFVIAVAFLFCLLTSCSVQKPGLGMQVNVKDSTVVHIKDSTVYKYVPVEVPIPVEVMREIVPASDSSHLETGIALSDAYIDTLGFLHHSLQNKKGTFIGTAPVEEHHHEVISQSEHQETVHEPPQIVEVEKQLNWWQKFRLGGFWVLLVVALVGWRREIWKLIKLLF